MSTIQIIAEVLDKEPSIITIWVLFGSIAILGFFLGRRHWLSAVGFVPVALIVGAICFEGFSSVGLLTSSESPSYVLQFYIAVAAGALLPIIGAIVGLLRTRVTR